MHLAEAHTVHSVSLHCYWKEFKFFGCVIVVAWYLSLKIGLIVMVQKAHTHNVCSFLLLFPFYMHNWNRKIYTCAIHYIGLCVRRFASFNIRQCRIYIFCACIWFASFNICARINEILLIIHTNISYREEK